MDLADAPREDRPRLLDEAEELLTPLRTISREAATAIPAFDAAFFAAELDHTRHWALEKGGAEPRLRVARRTGLVSRAPSRRRGRPRRDRRSGAHSP